MNSETEYLNKAEHDAYIDEFTPLVVETLNKIISLADKHNIDRDNAVEHFATIFKTMQEISTFAGFKPEGAP